MGHFMMTPGSEFGMRAICHKIPSGFALSLKIAKDEVDLIVEKLGHLKMFAIMINSELARFEAQMEEDI